MDLESYPDRLPGPADIIQNLPWVETASGLPAGFATPFLIAYAIDYIETGAVNDHFVEAAHELGVILVGRRGKPPPGMTLRDQRYARGITLIARLLIGWVERGETDEGPLDYVDLPDHSLPTVVYDWSDHTWNLGTLNFEDEEGAMQENPKKQQGQGAYNIGFVWGNNPDETRSPEKLWKEGGGTDFVLKKAKPLFIQGVEDGRAAAPNSVPGPLEPEEPPVEEPPVEEVEEVEEPHREMRERLRGMDEKKEELDAQLAEEAREHALQTITAIPDNVIPEIAREIVEVSRLEDIAESTEPSEEAEPFHAENTFKDAARRLERSLNLGDFSWPWEIFGWAGHPRNRLLARGEFLVDAMEHGKAGTRRGSTYPFPKSGSYEDYARGKLFMDAEDARWWELIQQRAQEVDAPDELPDHPDPYDIGFALGEAGDDQQGILKKVNRKWYATHADYEEGIERARSGFNAGRAALAIKRGDMIGVYTDAPADYDSFGTFTLDTGHGWTAKGQVRRVAVEGKNYEWQLMRYGSGLHFAIPEDQWPESVDLIVQPGSAEVPIPPPINEPEEAAEPEEAPPPEVKHAEGLPMGTDLQGDRKISSWANRLAKVYSPAHGFDNSYGIDYDFDAVRLARKYTVYPLLDMGGSEIDAEENKDLIGLEPDYVKSPPPMGEHMVLRPFRGYGTKEVHAKAGPPEHWWVGINPKELWPSEVHMVTSRLDQEHYIDASDHPKLGKGYWLKAFKDVGTGKIPMWEGLLESDDYVKSAELQKLLDYQLGYEAMSDEARAEDAFARIQGAYATTKKGKLKFIVKNDWAEPYVEAEMPAGADPNGPVEGVVQRTFGPTLRQRFIDVDSFEDWLGDLVQEDEQGLFEKAFAHGPEGTYQYTRGGAPGVHEFWYRWPPTGSHEEFLEIDYTEEDEEDEEPAEPDEGTITVERVSYAPRSEVPAATLAADYKARGIDRQASFSQFVRDRQLSPEMNSKDWYEIFDAAVPQLLEPTVTTSEVVFEPTHVRPWTGEKVMAYGEVSDFGIVHVITESGREGSDRIDQLQPLEEEPSREPSEPEELRGAGPVPKQGERHYVYTAHPDPLYVEFLPPDYFEVHEVDPQFGEGGVVFYARPLTAEDQDYYAEAHYDKLGDYPDHSSTPLAYVIEHETDYGKLEMARLAHKIRGRLLYPHDWLLDYLGDDTQRKAAIDEANDAHTDYDDPTGREVIGDENEGAAGGYDALAHAVYLDITGGFELPRAAEVVKWGGDSASDIIHALARFTEPGADIEAAHADLLALGALSDGVNDVDQLDFGYEPSINDAPGDPRGVWWTELPNGNTLVLDYAERRWKEVPTLASHISNYLGRFRQMSFAELEGMEPYQWNPS